MDAQAASIPGSSLPTALPFDIDATLGALQIGVLISYALFGVTTTQAYLYYTRFPDDARKIRFLVTFVWLCELGHAVCIGDMLYTYTITTYGHPEQLVLHTPKSILSGIVLSSIIAACVQGFFAYRIYCISKSLFIPVFSWLLSFLRVAAAIALLVAGLMSANEIAYQQQWGWLGIVQWSVSAANDLTITATLVWLLTQKRETAHKRTVPMIDRVITWTIETGMLTSIFTTTILICFVKMQTNFVWLSIYVIEARLFANSLLASLNSRTTLRAMNERSLPYSGPTRTPLSVELSIVKDKAIL